MLAIALEYSVLVLVSLVGRLDIIPINIKAARTASQSQHRGTAAEGRHHLEHNTWKWREWS